MPFEGTWQWQNTADLVFATAGTRSGAVDGLVYGAVNVIHGDTHGHANGTIERSEGKIESTVLSHTQYTTRSTVLLYLACQIGVVST